MMIARLLEGYDADASKGEDSKQSQVSKSPSARPPLPRVSPISYTSHAMMLHLQEYRSRVRSAFESTYRHPLNTSKGPGLPRKRDSHSGNYCRTRVLESSRLLFSQQTRSGAPVPSIAASPTRTSIKGGGVAFHRTTTSSRATAKSNLFALGPGQYDVAPRRPATTGSVKFSPADRFPEHSGGGASDARAPGPGQYLPDDRVTVKRSTRVVFSQIPRHTATAAPPQGSVKVAPATADVVSSYYYVPASGFVSPADSVSKTGSGIPNWSRSARFPGRQDRFRQISSNLSDRVDYISRNKTRIENISAQQRQRRQRQHPAAKAQEKTCSVRRRDSVFCTSLSSPNKEHIARRRSSSAGSVHNAETSETETISHAWGTLIVLSVAQTKLVRLFVASNALHRLRQAQELRYKRVTFESWTHVRSRDSMRSLAAALIARSTFRFRLSLRIQQKIRAAKLLRMFLSGLSFDVRFAMAVRRMQRRIILLQRWWRHARLVVRAREQCLACKWLTVEQRLRTETIAPMPYLQRVFQPPSTAPLTSSRASSASTRRKASTMGPMTVEAPVPLHKLLHLPEQKRWFNARFVLRPDGSLRGYVVPDPDTVATENTEECLVVEVKHFRCHAHGFSNVSLGSTHTCDEGEKYIKPYLMIFKPGASRFVLITDTTSLILAPLMDWKEKLEQVARSFNGLSYSASGEIADMLSQTENLGLEDVNEEPVVVPSSHRMSISTNIERSGSTTQGRRRSSRCSIRRSNVFQPIAEGNLSYYVVDILRDCPRIPAPIVWNALRDKLREERKNFRSDIYRFKLEIARYQQHEQERRQLVVLDKFKEFFTMERPRRPHFRSLISNRQMEALVRETIEFVKTTQPSNPKFMLPS